MQHLDLFDDVLLGHSVDFAPTELRIRHSPKPNICHMSWQFTGRCPNHSRQGPKRNIVRFDLVCGRQSAELWRLPVVAADSSLDHAFMREMVHALVFAVSDGSTKNDGQVGRFSGRQEPSFKGSQYFFGCILGNIAANCDGISTFNEMNSVVSAHYFMSCGSMPNLNELKLCDSLRSAAGYF